MSHASPFSVSLPASAANTGLVRLVVVLLSSLLLLGLAIIGGLRASG
jgi:hypothetical protein